MTIAGTMKAFTYQPGLKKWIVAIQDMPSKQPFVFAHLLLHAGDGSPWDAGKKYR